MPQQSNTLKCKYCDYTCSRFRGRHKYQGRKIFIHVIDNHEREFLESVGFKGTIAQYLDEVREEDAAQSDY
jgi:hypothetical protein